MSSQEASQETRSFDWALWWQWVLVSTLGWLLGWTLVHQVVIGAVIGIAQWLVLRRLVSRAGWWILASTVGWAVGAAVVTLVFPPQPGVLAGAVLGAMTGLAQWFVLRRWVRQAGWWVLISALGWAIGLIGVLGASLAGAVVGAVTGIALELLLRHPHPNLEM